MPIADQDEVRRLMAEFEPRLREVADAAWQEWMEFPDRGRIEYVGRLRAAFVFDAFVRRARAEFADDGEVRVIPKSQTAQFLFKDQVLVRFKKGNARGVGSNIETQAVLDFIDPQRSIPGLLPDLLRIEVCYQPDDLGTRLDDVAVVARNRTRRVWAYSLRPDEGRVIPLPQDPPDQTPPVVTPRRVAKKKGSGTTE